MTYFPIYLNRDLTVWCVVDLVDYLWAIQHTWNYKPGTVLLGHKYAKRNTGAERRPVYLHREVLLLADPQTVVLDPRRRYADHIDGNTLDCRRSNLRWATASENAKNVGGRSFCVPLCESTSLLPF